MTQGTRTGYKSLKPDNPKTNKPKITKSKHQKEEIYMFLTCLKIFSFPNIQYITSHSQLQVTWAEAEILKYSTSSSVYCNIFQKVNNDNTSF